MPRLSWPVAWTAAGAAAVALLAANVAAPPVLAVSAPPVNAAVFADHAAPRPVASGTGGTDVTPPISTPAVTGTSVSPTPVAGDTTPPSKPAGLRANCLPDFRGTSLCWSESTDDVGVAAYDIYRRTDTAWILVGTKPAGTWNFLEGNLVTGQTYTYVIVARDAAGNLSLPSDPIDVIASGGYPGTNSPPASPPASPSVSTSPPATCKVEYGSWSFPGGFTARVKITNTGSSAVSGWTLRFAFPDAGQKVAQGYSATWSQSGKDVTAVNLSWNKVIDPGKSVLIGFTGRQTGANPDPAAFTLNNRTCVKS
ncbi:cellulose binding domain-containing protein [Microbispora amethystogenes]|uniref:CBM2 domain-containing protein n=1 Tax=Microbispora amethystogenes TaxID=1427754 RepID=A0ABQ4FCC0_9ACTN|nr:cellulose binding domain-containing protein [Microbispora amethystogenes]GIH32443.1 hypothetical protein Mam01_26070 [Microbispora amethystogenes]